MKNRIWLSLVIAIALLALLAIGVMAQNTVIDPDDAEEAGAAFVEIEPVTATVRQRVPVSVTLRIPLGTTETQTVTIPMLLSLDLQISLGEFISPSLALTAELGTVGLITTPLTATVGTATPTPLPPTPTPLPPTPTPLPPTPTPLPPTPVPTSVVTTTEPITETAPVTDTETVTETESPDEPESDSGAVVLPNCSDPRSVIVFPGVNQTLAGTVDIVGSATHENFQYYKLEYAIGADASPAADYFWFGGGNSPVESGVLAPFDTQELPNGAYTVRLTVVDNTGNFPAPCSVTVQVEN
ncbi:MAG: hypothetical protein DCC55_26705 [Chloroflexi bacterium]|nr:MAG: hypothetical protein DCC55_26705 [Chloroflexota bacterium]